MIENEKISYDFSKCSSEEMGILEKYWEMDSKRKFPISLQKICNEYNLIQSQLYKLASTYHLTWDFGHCECGEPIFAHIHQRTELLSCLNNSGPIHTFRSIEYFRKCEKCRSIEEQKEMEAQFNEPTIELGELYDNGGFDYENKKQPVIIIPLLNENQESHNEYTAFLDIDNDIVLEAGKTYEFVATATTDKNIILQIKEIMSNSIFD